MNIKEYLSARYILMLLINTVAVFVAFNLLVWSYYAIYDVFFDPFSNAVEESYKIKIDKYYPGFTQNEIDQLISETYRSFQYEPFVQFRENARNGKYVNVSEYGFRVSAAQSKWPPDPQKPVIFVFGGSTTFGYGVRDEDTVVSALSKELRQNPRYSGAQFYNFGRGFYWSTQENILFTTLLLSGVKPSMAIFIDGINEFYYSRQSPQFSDTMRIAFNREIERTGTLSGQFLNLWDSVRGLLLSLPMVQLARDIRSKISRQQQAPTLLPYNPKSVRASIANYLTNKSIIKKTAELYHIDTLFVWQPIPTFKYPSHFYKEFAARFGFGPHSQSFYGYPQMYKLNETHQDKTFAWCADVLEGTTTPLFVDLVHYNRRGAGLLSDCIVNAIKSREK